MPASSSTSASGATPCFGRWPVTVACSVRTAQSSARRCRCSEAVRAALPDRRQRCGIRRPRLLRRAGAFVFSIDPLALTLLQILKSLVWTSGSTRQSPRPPHQPVAATTAARRPPQGRRHWPAATATRLYFEPGDRFGNFAAGCRFRVDSSRSAARSADIRPAPGDKKYGKILFGSFGECAVPNRRRAMTAVPSRPAIRAAFCCLHRRPVLAVTVSCRAPLTADLGQQGPHIESRVPGVSAYSHCRP